MTASAGDIFLLLCGRGRCLVIDGAELWVCQRCLGLYVGAAVAWGVVLAGGLARRGLPPGRVLAAQAVALGLALLGGLHVVDPSAAWRVTCGLWTGQVAVGWMIGGASELTRRDRSAWSVRDQLAAIGPLAIAPMAGWLIAAGPPGSRWVWNRVALLGAILAAAALLLCLPAIGVRCVGHIGRHPTAQAKSAVQTEPEA